MTRTEDLKVSARRPLRLWPGVVIAVSIWLARFGTPILDPDAAMYAVLGAAAGGLLIVLWWLFASRAPWSERLGGVGLIIIGLIGTRPLLDESIATAGMGYLYPIFAVPIVATALVVWAIATQNLPDRTRRLSMVGTILLASLGWTLVRTGGISNSEGSELAWRWTETAEERLLARADEGPIDRPAALTASEVEAEWPGFRGPDRNGVVRGVRIETDWSVSPPVELWRRPVGPGWSSFAVAEEHFFTQEQRGEHEIVSCYLRTTGEPVWQHQDETRFWESNAGAGPRATPTLHDGRLYSFGATGILNALDAADGSVRWSRNAATDTGVEVPIWGFASSPLVVDDVVIVATAGQLAAYERSTGEPRWFGPDGGDGYSSPHLLELDGVPQVLLMSLAGAVSFEPARGTLLWEHAWPGSTRIVQPALTADGDLLMSRGTTSGMRRLSAGVAPGGWAIEERWDSNGLKPYFSDFVVHEGHAYGFDGNILASIDVKTGVRNWKGGRYGSGQMLLLADQDLLLVISEKGELALVEAVPHGFTELARFPALKGKTWNHPVLVDDSLLLRNDREMAAFRLALAAP